MTNNDIYDTAIAVFRYQGIKMTDFETLATCLHVPVNTVCERFASSKEILVFSTVRFEIEREYKYVNNLSLSLSPLKFIGKLYVHAIRFFHSFHSSFFKDLRHYQAAVQEFDCYIAHLRGRFNEALQSCILQGLCTKECDSFMFSSFLCMRMKEIREGIICRKEKISGISKFLVSTLLMGCCTEKGRKELMEILGQ